MKMLANTSPPNLDSSWKDRFYDIIVKNLNFFQEIWLAAAPNRAIWIWEEHLKEIERKVQLLFDSVLAEYLAKVQLSSLEERQRFRKHQVYSKTNTPLTTKNQTIVKVLGMTGPRSQILKFQAAGISFQDWDVRDKIQIYQAVSNGHVDYLHLLLEHGEDPHLNIIKGDGENEEELSLLQIAAKLGNLELVDTLVFHGAIMDDSSVNPLHQALQYGHSDILFRLLEAGADAGSFLRSMIYPDKDGEDEGDDDEQEKEVHEDKIERIFDIKSKLFQVLLNSMPKISLEGRADDGNTLLMIASEKGDINLVKMLVSVGANVNSLNDNNETAVVLASKGGHLSVVEYLLRQGANKNTQSWFVESDGSIFRRIKATPLVFSIELGFVDIANALICNGADLNVLTGLGTALHVAARKGNEDLVKILGKKRCSLDTIFEKDGTALTAAILAGNIETAKLLLEVGASVSPTFEQACYDKMELSAISQYHEGDIDYPVIDIALTLACRKGMAAVVKNLATLTPVDLWNPPPQSPFTDSYKRAIENPFQFPIVFGHVAISEILLDSGFPLEYKCKLGGGTPVFLAAQFGRVEILGGLLQAGANCLALSSDGESALLVAIKNGHSDCAMMLARSMMDHHPEEFEVKKDECLVLSAKCCSKDTVVFFIQAGANINFQGKSGETALFNAAELKRFDIIEVLLRGNADPNIQDDEGRTALIIACRSIIYQVHSLYSGLYAHKGKNQKSYESILKNISYSSQLAAIDILLRFGADVNIRAKDESTALCHVVNGHQIPLKHCLDDYKGPADQALKLVEYGAIVNLNHSEGRCKTCHMNDQISPLISFLSHPTGFDVAAKMIEVGADVNFQYISKQTPLFYLLSKVSNEFMAFSGEEENKDQELIRMLVKAGADINHEAWNRRTPLEAAVESRSAKNVQTLLDLGAKFGTEKLSRACWIFLCNNKEMKDRLTGALKENQGKRKWQSDSSTDCTP